MSCRTTATDSHGRAVFGLGFQPSTSRSTSCWDVYGMVPSALLHAMRYGPVCHYVGAWRACATALGSTVCLRVRGGGWRPSRVRGHLTQ
jgi:hypothetical protein